jgi:hypothetical protein
VLIGVIAFELRKRLARVSSYVYFFGLGGLAIALAAASLGKLGGFSTAANVSQVYINSPQVLHGLMSIAFIFGLPVLAALFGAAVQQDSEARVHPLLFTTGITRWQYLAGRFAGALVAALAIFSSIGLGLWLLRFMPFVDRAWIGPDRLLAYLWPYAVTLLPNVLFAGAIFFTVGALVRGIGPVHVSAAVLLLACLVSFSVGRNLEDARLAALLDPSGLNALFRVTQGRTPAERAGLLVPLEGVLLENRLVWLALSLALLGFIFWHFRFDRDQSLGKDPGRRGGGRSHQALPSGAELGAAPAPGPAGCEAQVARTGERALPLLAPLLRLTRLAFMETIKTRSFGVIVLLSLLSLLGLARSAETSYGTPIYPVTRWVVELTSTIFSPFFGALLVLYAGELVFRERDARVDALIDTLPLPDWLLFVPKLLGLFLVQALLLGVVMLSGLMLQQSQRFHVHELGLYVHELFGVQQVGYVLLCVLFMAVQVAVQHKYVGYFLCMLVFAAQWAGDKLGIEHNLLRYGGNPGSPYSDMNGYGHFLAAVRWFQGYWGLFALLIAIATYLLWQRGAEASASARARAARRRFTRPVAILVTMSSAAFVVVGAFIFYNTNILNHYQTQEDREQAQADYELRYGATTAEPQPRITSVKLELELFPEQQRLRAKGTYTLTNKTDQSITRVHVSLPDDAGYERLTLGGAKPTSVDTKLAWSTFELAEPLAPGAQLPLEFQLDRHPHGFGNALAATDIVDNGSFISSPALPGIGYQRAYELGGATRRARYGLPSKALPEPGDASELGDNYVTANADWISFDATVSTAPDQIAVAPGYLEREWSEAGRRYFHYRMDRPILPFFSVLSARYRVAKDRWNGVGLEIYYHPGHEYNLARMMQSMKDTLAYCSSAFGPYQHHQLRIVEFPRYRSIAQSFPNTIPYSEGLGFVAKADMKDGASVDFPYYITAHEVAHQWWGNQVVGGNVRGATFLSESMAQYTALMVMKQAFGPASMRRFLRYELDAYLKARGKANVRESPLARDDRQQYVHYNKGSLALFALADYLGEERVNRAARRFIEKFAFAEPPYPSSLDLIAGFREEAPADLAYLIDDLFDRIVQFDNSATSATSERLADGRYQVTLDLQVRKHQLDPRGKLVSMPLGDLIEVGVLDEHGVATHLEKRWFRGAAGTITLVVDAPPFQAGVDPRNLLIDRKPEDNVIPVLERPPGAVSLSAP